MNCPYCERDMDLGYIQCRDGVHWTPKPQLVSALSFLGKGSIPLNNGAADNAKIVFAYRCSHCRKVIIEYAEKPQTKE